jgi:very-short-patch-repair endonuclease
MREHSSYSSQRRAVFAHELRAAPTWSEQLLWARLAGKRLGVGFRRQMVIGKSIVDFAAPSKRLVVEVDGGYHATRRRADARRDRELARLAWRVLRLPVALVEKDIEEAVAAIVRSLEGA